MKIKVRLFSGEVVKIKNLKPGANITIPVKDKSGEYNTFVNIVTNTFYQYPSSNNGSFTFTTGHESPNKVSIDVNIIYPHGGELDFPQEVIDLSLADRLEIEFEDDMRFDVLK